MRNRSRGESMTPPTNEYQISFVTSRGATSGRKADSPRDVNEKQTAGWYFRLRSRKSSSLDQRNCHVFGPRGEEAATDGRGTEWTGPRPPDSLRVLAHTDVISFRPRFRKSLIFQRGILPPPPCPSLPPTYVFLRSPDPDDCRLLTWE